MAPCRSALQLLLDTCESYGSEWCLTYNPSKSKIMMFGSRLCSPSFLMYGKQLDLVKEYKYLGVTIVSGKTFSTAVLRPLIRFRSSANTILNVPHASSEPVLMKLLYCICIPHLTYACDVISYSVKQMQSLNVALNDCIRKVFGYNRWESVRFLRLSFGYPSVTDIFAARARSFYAKSPVMGNSTLKRLSEISLT